MNSCRLFLRLLAGLSGIGFLLNALWDCGDLVDEGCGEDCFGS